MVTPAVRTVLFNQYRPEARAIFAAMTTPPTSSWRNLVNQRVKALLSAGVWPSLDEFYYLAAPDQQVSRINWKDPTKSLTAVNSPTFTANKGWTFAATQCLSTGYDYSAGIAGANYTLNSAHAFVFCNTDVNSTVSFDLGSDVSNNIGINARYNTGIFGRLNYQSGGDIFGTVATSVGMTLMNRTNGTNAQYCKDGSVLYDRVVSAGGLPGNIVIGNIQSNDATRYSRRQISAAGVGGGLNTAILPAYFSAVYDGLHSLGAV